MLSGLSGYIKNVKNDVKKAFNNQSATQGKPPSLGRIRMGMRDIEEINLISQGGYAYVFKVRDQNGQIYALKKMICQSPERFQTAKNEINMLRALPSHPNLLEVYDSLIEQKEGVYYVYVLLEYCGDGSIFDLMAKYESTKLSEKQIIFIMREVCEGVKVLHTQNPPITHRDIKIENVLLNNKRFKLCDFGSCSTSVVDFSKVSQSQYAQYEEEYDKNTTLMYRPPEMCDLYQRLVVSTKVDVWMLGCVVYTMAFYKHPFQECSKLSIINAAYSFPTEHSYSAKLVDLIRVMLTPNPKTRPNIHEVCDLFQNYFNINHIELNADAQKVKQMQDNNANDIKKFENTNTRKFNGDVPVEELMKLQKKLANSDDGSPREHLAPPPSNFKSHQHSKSANKSDQLRSDFDNFNSFNGSPGIKQSPNPAHFNSNPGTSQNSDWASFKPKQNSQTVHQQQSNSFSQFHTSNQANQNSFGGSENRGKPNVDQSWQNFSFNSNSNNQNTQNQSQNFNQNGNNAPRQGAPGAWNPGWGGQNNQQGRQFNSVGNQGNNMMNNNNNNNNNNAGFNAFNNFSNGNNQNQQASGNMNSQFGFNNQSQSQQQTTVVSNDLLDLAEPTPPPAKKDTATGIMALYSLSK